MRASNPQTMNRYTFVLNNPLRYVDPDGLKEKDPWDELTKEEQDALSTRLKLDKEFKTERERFNALVSVRGKDGKIDAQATAERVDTVKNFIAAMGGLKDSAVWNQVNKIENVSRSELSFTVFSSPQFVQALNNERFAQDSSFDQKFSIHKGISLRAETEYWVNPGFHITNDHPQQTPNNYEAHWDPTSTNFQKALDQFQEFPYQTERMAAGMYHLYGGHASPAEVKEYLKKTKQMPSQ